MSRPPFVLLAVVIVMSAGATIAGSEELQSQITGRTWLAREIGGKSAVPGVHSTIELSADGLLSGSGGCNRLNGSWTLQGDNLRFGPLAMTMMMCLGERSDQESRFIAALEKGARVEISGDVLILHPREGGGLLRFVESKPAKISGVVVYRERMALPKDAVVMVRLVDVSKMDVPAVVLANQLITPGAEVPIPFSMDYESAEIDERMTYAVDAEIRVGDRLMFRSPEQHPVLTRGATKDEVEIEVERVK